MDASDIEPAAIAKWDPEPTERLMGLIRPVIKGWHRAEVRGLDAFPTGGALVVANHSGGLFAMDVRFSPPTSTPRSAMTDRSAHSATNSSSLPTGDFFKRIGFTPGSHDLAAQRRFAMIG